MICRDAVEVLRDALTDASLDEVLVFFPDPWHKKRHHKRRLIEPVFIAQLARKLRPDEPLLESLSADRTFVARPPFRPPTRFERRGERLGHGVWDLAYRRPGAEPGRDAGPGRDG